MVLVKNSNYWTKRFQAAEQESYQKAKKYIDNLKKQYDIAERRLNQDLLKWYNRIAKNNQISYSDALKLLDDDALEEFKWSLDEYIKMGKQNGVDPAITKQLENASAKVHINWIQAQQVQMKAQVEILMAQYKTGLTGHLEDVFQGTYLKSAYDIAVGTHTGTMIQALDFGTIEKFLKSDWVGDGSTLSDRIWTNKTKLINELNRELSQCVIRGNDVKTAINTLSKTMEVSRSNAGRLVMTETAAIQNDARKECFKDLDVEEYEYVATLDEETCDICGPMDGKRFKMSQCKVGVNAGPLHCWCRCTLAPVFDDVGTTRAARGKDGKTYYVDSKMTFTDWKKQYYKED